MLKLKIFLNSFLVSIGIQSGFVTILWSIWSTDLGNKVKSNEYIFISIIISVSILYALFMIRRRNHISIKLTKHVRTNIFFGDLFQFKGIVVIPVNEYFDTIVDEKIISSNTLHGLFIKQFFSDTEKDLKQQITKSLSNTIPLEVNDTRKQGNKKRYALGTVAQVSKNDKLFYLVALTRFNENNRAEVKKSEYQRVLFDLFDYIEQNSQGSKVYLPLIGGGHSGVDLTKQTLLEILLFSITLNDKLTLINGLYVVLYKSIKPDIDLSKIHYHYKQ
jgi:hypothetical protein